MKKARIQGSEHSGKFLTYQLHSGMQSLRGNYWEIYCLSLPQIHAWSEQRTNNAWVPGADDRFPVAALEWFVESDARATMFAPRSCCALFKSNTGWWYASPNGIGLDCTRAREPRCIEQRAIVGRKRTWNGPIGGQRAPIPKREKRHFDVGTQPIGRYK